MLDKNLIERVIFFNNFGNGDIHYSREFIKFFSKKIEALSFINHKKCPTLLKDTEMPFIQANLTHLNQNGFHFQNGVLFFNTWIGQEAGKWIQKHPSGCNLRNNYKMFSEKAKILGLEMPSEDYFIPSIEYGFFNTKDIKINPKSILFANGPCLSGQSKNFNMDEVIIKLSQCYPHCSFYTTQKINIDLKNVIDVNEIIIKDKNLSNLNEISYISSFCDIIVGRASGPFCFTHTKNNLYDKNKTFISACDNESEGRWASFANESIRIEAKELWCDTKNDDYLNNLILLIQKEIENKYGSS